MNKISRKGFLKIAAAAAMSGVTAGALAACNSASGSTASGAAGQYIPGTYEGTAEGISSTVKVTMTFSDSAVTDVVVDTLSLIHICTLPGGCQNGAGDGEQLLLSLTDVGGVLVQLHLVAAGQLSLIHI